MIIFSFFYLLIVNIISFLMFFIDKKRSIKKSWRISENNLFFISILGGSIGSLFSMYIFHHKTKHLKFTIGISLILILQLIILFYLFFNKNFINILYTI